MNITLQRIDGSAFTFDTNNLTAVAAMTAAQLLAAGVSEGTRITVSGAVTDVSGNVNEVLSDINGGFPGFAGSTVATRTALAAILAADRSNGQIVTVRSDASRWIFNATSGAAADYTGDVAGAAVTSANLVIVPTDGAGGRWIRADKSFIARYRFQNATPDNTALCLVPASMCMRLTGLPYINFTTVVVGDGARRVGASGSFGAFGGNAGDFIGSTAPAAGPIASTLGADFAAAVGDTQTFVLYQTCLIREGETITYDLIAAGAAGAAADGMICVPVALETPTTMIS